MEKLDNFKSLCIFTEYGCTYTFKDVTILVDNESILAFEYLAMSDESTKIATFSKLRIAGYSVMD